MLDLPSFGRMKYPAETKTLAGRACLKNMMTNDPAQPEGNLCLYYDKGVSDGARGLSPDLRSWSQESWYVGNHSVCGSKGMRLPVLYETDVQFSPGFSMFPNGQSGHGFSRSTSGSFPESPVARVELFTQAGGVPPVAVNGNVIGTWTATSNGLNSDQYFVWSSLEWTDSRLEDGRFFDKYSNTNTIKGIRCVLPSSDAFVRTP